MKRFSLLSFVDSWVILLANWFCILAKCRTSLDAELKEEDKKSSKRIILPYN
jgi:hypothetical protein